VCRSPGGGPLGGCLPPSGLPGIRLGQRTGATGWYGARHGWLPAAQRMTLYVLAACGVAFTHARNGDGELALSVPPHVPSLGEAPSPWFGIPDPGSEYPTRRSWSGAGSNCRPSAFQKVCHRPRDICRKKLDRPPGQHMGLPRACGTILARVSACAGECRLVRVSRVLGASRNRTCVAFVLARKPRAAFGICPRSRLAPEDCAARRRTGIVRDIRLSRRYGPAGSSCPQSGGAARRGTTRMLSERHRAHRRGALHYLPQHPAGRRL
jgi:hypothetical protein